MTYGSDEPALDDVSFALREGERVAVIGPNGAGKSTLFQSILGLQRPQQGRIQLHNMDAQQIGYVPQHEGVSWDFPVTVRDVVMLGLTRQIGWLRWPNRRHWQQVEHALERVGLSEFAHRQVGELSGGQRRRVFIARALAQNARLLILDEPFSGVDVHAQTGLMDVLTALNTEGLTILLSTHDLNLAFSHFDRVLALRRSIIAFDKPDRVYQPEILTRMYGGRLTIMEKDHQVSVYVDEHGCH